MKKIIVLLLALMLALPLAVRAEGTGFGLGTMYVYTENGLSLHVRSTPDTGDNIIGEAPFGSALNVVGFEGGWARVEWGNGYAYVMKRFLQWYVPESKPTPKPDTSSSEKAELASEFQILPCTGIVHATRTSGWGNLRAKPVKTSTLLERLPDGAEVQIFAQTTNWYRVTDPATGVIGYIHQMFVDMIPASRQTPAPADETTIGTLKVNGQFQLRCTIPAGYRMQILSAQSSRIIASLTSDDSAKPGMLLTVAFDETYAGVERFNDLTEEQVAALKATFTDINEVEFSEKETSQGTKLLVAREVGGDSDFVDILSVYKGYFIEFLLSPNPDSAAQALTDEQVQMCVDFLSNLEFVPAN